MPILENRGVSILGGCGGAHLWRVRPRKGRCGVRVVRMRPRDGVPLEVFGCLGVRVADHLQMYTDN